MTAGEDAPSLPPAMLPALVALPPGVLVVRPGPGANCSSAGSAIDVLFYGSVLVGAIAVALAAAFPPGSDDDEPAAAPDADSPSSSDRQR